MKFLAMAALGLWVALPGMAAADASYRLYQGDAVKGLSTLDGVPVRTADTVCRDQDCYQLYRSRPADVRYLRQLGIRHYSFDAVARAAGVRREGAALLLPEAFGWELYRNARNDDWASNSPGS